MWRPLEAKPAADWHEIEALLAAPADNSVQRAPRGIPSFAFVVAALVIGLGVLAVTLTGGRSDCGTACHVVTAGAGPTSVPAVKTAEAAPRSDAGMTEGRSVAEPAPAATDGADGAKADAAAPEIPAFPRRHHHHHHHYVTPY